MDPAEPGARTYARHADHRLDQTRLPLGAGTPESHTSPPLPSPLGETERLVREGRVGRGTRPWCELMLRVREAGAGAA